MSARHETYVIVGGGIAGSAAAQAIRLRDPRGSILLIGLEVNRPYNRPPLSSQYLLRKTTRGELSTLPLGWYADNAVQLATGKRVGRIDPARRMVILDAGDEILFDHLLIATGATPKRLHVPGAEMPGIYELRTIEDADRLLNAIDAARREGRPHDPAHRTGPRGRAVIVGGGLLGVELAGTLSTAGLHVDLVVAEPHPWKRFAGPTVGAHLSRALESHGVRLHPSARVARFDGDGRVQRVILDGGKSLDCDLVVVAIGAAFNREILRGTPINAEKSILVDDHCRTNVPHVYAAGDCAAVFDPLFGKHRILEHWESARLTGTIAGANMAGDDMSYDAVSHFGSEVFGMKLTAWGESRHVAHRHTRVLEGGIVEFGVSAQNRISQTLSVSTAKPDDSTLRELVRRRLDVSSIIEKLTDPKVDLKSLL